MPWQVYLLQILLITGVLLFDTLSRVKLGTNPSKSNVGKSY
ncbi:hypothetical protein [Aerococcus viridans]